MATMQHHIKRQQHISNNQLCSSRSEGNSAPNKKPSILKLHRSSKLKSKSADSKKPTKPSVSITTSNQCACNSVSCYNGAGYGTKVWICNACNSNNYLSNYYILQLRSFIDWCKPAWQFSSMQQWSCIQTSRSWCQSVQITTQTIMKCLIWKK